MNIVRVKLPRQFKEGTLGHVQRQLPDPINHIPSDVLFDFSDLQFIRPCAIIYLCNLVEWLTACGSDVSIDGYEQYQPPIGYLEDAGVFDRILGYPLRKTRSPRATTFPFSTVETARARNELASRLMPWISRETGYSVSALSNLESVLAELFNNVADHTERDISGVFAQHYPNENRVMLAVADIGCGIPANVRREESADADWKAIIRATDYGFTTGTPQNFGVGLDQLLSTIVGLNMGEVTIRSSRGVVQCRNRAGEIKRSGKDVLYECVGTVIEISVPTDNDAWVGGSEEEEDLEW